MLPKFFFYYAYKYMSIYEALPFYYAIGANESNDEKDSMDIF